MREPSCGSTDSIATRLTTRGRLATILQHEHVAMWIDPLLPRDHERLPRLARQCSVPIAVASTVRSPFDVLEIAREEAIRAVVFAAGVLGRYVGRA